MPLYRLPFINGMKTSDGAEKYVPETPAIIVTRGLEPPQSMPQEMDHSSKGCQSLMSDDLPEHELAKTTSLHGVLVDVYGVC